MPCFVSITTPHQGIKYLVEMLQGVRETRVREGPVEVVTLHVETSTPRRRTLRESYKRQCTPNGELPAAWLRRRSAESSARSRAMCRLQPIKHAEQLLEERKRKRNTKPNAKHGSAKRVPTRLDPEWQRHELCKHDGGKSSPRSMSGWMTTTL